MEALQLNDELCCRVCCLEYIQMSVARALGRSAAL